MLEELYGLVLGDLDLGGEQERPARGRARVQEQPEPPPEQALGLVRRQVLEFRRSQRTSASA